VSDKQIVSLATRLLQETSKTGEKSNGSFYYDNIVAWYTGNLERILSSVGAVLEYEAIFFVTIETAKCQLFLELCFQDSSSHATYQCVLKMPEAYAKLYS
jgi:hypothetical protein